MTGMSLSNFRKDYYSQNGEDGVVAEILRRLGMGRGFCVEFGAWDGTHLSNTYRLVKSEGWDGLYIEADPRKFEDLLQNEMVAIGRITPVNTLVTSVGEDCLDKILARHNVRKDFELLSIDIDGADLDVWEGVRDYHPKIVVIEIDSRIEPTVARTLPNGRPERSFANMLRLGKEKGYALVCHTGNMIFVANELAGKLGIDR